MPRRLVPNVSEYKLHHETHDKPWSRFLGPEHPDNVGNRVVSFEWRETRHDKPPDVFVILDALVNGNWVDVSSVHHDPNMDVTVCVPDVSSEVGGYLIHCLEWHKSISWPIIA